MKTKSIVSQPETLKQAFESEINLPPGPNLQTVLITGATSGIGQAFAWHYACLGYNLILTGRRQEKLTILAHQLRLQYNIEVETVCGDLSSNHDLNLLLRTISNCNNIFIIVNNAGFGSGKDFCENEINRHLQMVNVHVVASLKLIHAILPQMMARRQGSIINVSSLAAFTPAPGSCTYSATKMFLLTFSESLAMELKDSGITVKCLCPGFTRTEFHEKLQPGLNHGKRSLAGWMKADTVVQKCQRSLSNSKTIYIPGIFNKLLVGLISIIPRMTYYKLMRKLAV